jgi:hypothetical protein
MTRLACWKRATLASQQGHTLLQASLRLGDPIAPKQMYVQCAQTTAVETLATDACAGMLTCPSRSDGSSYLQLALFAGDAAEAAYASDGHYLSSDGGPTGAMRAGKPNLPGGHAYPVTVLTPAWYKCVCAMYTSGVHDEFSGSAAWCIVFVRTMPCASMASALCSGAAGGMALGLPTEAAVGNYTLWQHGAAALRPRQPRCTSCLMNTRLHACVQT